MRFFLEMGGTSEGTSSYMVRFVLRHHAAGARFALRYRNEHSPEIPLTLPFSSIFQVFPRVTLTQTTLKITVSGRCACVCACVWLCIVYVVCCVLCYICSKNMRKSINMENKTGSNHGHNVVRKCKKNTRNIGKLSKHGLLFWHDMAIHGPKKGPKTVIFPDALFLRFPWDLPTFSAESPIPNTKKALFRPRS